MIQTQQYHEIFKDAAVGGGSLSFVALSSSVKEGIWWAMAIGGVVLLTLRIIIAIKVLRSPSKKDDE